MVRSTRSAAVKPSVTFTRSQARKALSTSLTPASGRLRAQTGLRSEARVLRSATNPTSSSPRTPPSRSQRASKRQLVGAYPRPRKSKPAKPVRKPRAPKPTHFTCRICAEELPVEEYIEFIAPRRYRDYILEIPSQCIPHLTGNPRKDIAPVCRSCISQSMVARHNLVGARKVSDGCLEPGCDTHWDFTHIMQFFPPGEPLEKYNVDMLRVYLDQAHIVKCPNETCGNHGFPKLSAPGYPQVQCSIPTCKLRFCATCVVPWHADLTCSEYTARHVNATMTDPEKETLSLMQKKDGKRCPNCYLVIEKDGGCNSMYCFGCRTYFDWSTAASAIPGHVKAVPAHQNGGYFNPSVPIVCEMDALEAKERMRVDSPHLEDAGPEGLSVVVAAV